MPQRACALRSSKIRSTGVLKFGSGMDQKDHPHTIIIERPFNFGLLGLIIGFVGIFALSFILSPLAFILGLIGVCKRQFLTGLVAVVFSVIGVMTSVVLMTIFGLTSLMIDWRW